MRKPGTKPRRHNNDGRCLQLSTACVLGCHWKDAPMGGGGEEEIDRITGEEFWDNWEDGLERFGYSSEQFSPNGENEPKGFWIAIVHGSYSTTHAVVMKGRDLYYDPSGGRKHRPHKFYAGYELVRNGDN